MGQWPSGLKGLCMYLVRFWKGYGFGTYISSIMSLTYLTICWLLVSHGTWTVVCWLNKCLIVWTTLASSLYTLCHPFYYMLPDFPLCFHYMASIRCHQTKNVIMVCNDCLFHLWNVTRESLWLRTLSAAFWTGALQCTTTTTTTITML